MSLWQIEPLTEKNVYVRAYIYLNLGGYFFTQAKPAKCVKLNN